MGVVPHAMLAAEFPSVLFLTENLKLPNDSVDKSATHSDIVFIA